MWVLVFIEEVFLKGSRKRREMLYFGFRVEFCFSFVVFKLGDGVSRLIFLDLKFFLYKMG